MNRRKHLKLVKKPPTFKTFRLFVVTHEGVKMFFDPVTKRALLEIRAGELPFQSTIELWRNGECLAKATATIVGSRDASSAFEGTPPLVVRDAWLEQEARRDYQRTGTFGSTISVRRSGIHVGDELLITFPRQRMCNIEPRLGVNQWFLKVTLPTQDAAVDVRRGECVWKQIDRLMPDDTTAMDFWFRHHDKPWRDALRIAKRFVRRRAARTSLRSRSS